MRTPTRWSTFRPAQTTRGVRFQTALQGQISIGLDRLLMALTPDRWLAPGQQPGTPVYTADLPLPEAREAIGQARPDHNRGDGNFNALPSGLGMGRRHRARARRPPPGGTLA